MRLARGALVAAVLAGCSKPAEVDPFPTPTDVTPVEQATLALAVADDTLTSAAAVDTSWTVDGGATGLDLVIQLRAPGDPSPLGAKSSIWQGLPPPTGALAYLAADGTWSSTPVVYGPAVSGARMLTLPSTAPGIWRLEAFLQRADAPVAMAVAPVYVSDAPAFALEVNRTVLPLGARLRAELVTLAGKSPAPVRVSAWLRDPAGLSVGLPGRTAGASLLADGPSDDAHLTLFDGPLEAEGVYHLVVTQYDAAGAVLEAGEAELEVCAGTAMVAGLVAAEGAPVPGARITVLPLESHGMVGGVAGDDGQFALELPPGRYAFAAGAAGFSIDAKPLVVSCGQTRASLDFTLARTTSSGQGLGSRGVARQPVQLPPYGSGLARDWLPTIRVSVLPIAGEHASQDLVDGLMQLFVYQVIQAVPLSDVGFLTQSNAERLMGFIKTEMLAGSQDLTLAESAQEVGAFDFVVLGILEKSANVQQLTVGLSKGSRLIDRHDGRFADENGAGQLAESIGVQFRRASASDNTVLPLLPALRSWQDLPLNPHFELRATPDRPEPGAMVDVAVTLTESTANAPPGANRAFDFWYGPVGTFPQHTVLVTDATGVAHFPYTAGTQQTKFRAVFKHADESIDIFPQPRQGLALVGTKANVLEHEHVTCTLKLDSPTGPLGGKVVTLTPTGATGSTVDVPQVRTNSAGKATFELTAGRPGIAEVRAEQMGANPPETASLYFNVEAIATVTVTPQPFTTLLSNGQTDFYASVQISGSPAPGRAVTFALTGEGSLASQTATTDVTGLAHVRYTAPAMLSGSATVSATVAVDGNRYTGEAMVTYAPPCATCPPAVKPTDPSVPKLGTVQFHASEPVTWTTTAGSIDNDGTLHAPMAGGWVHVTATSKRNPALTTTVGALVACSVAELTHTWPVTIAAGAMSSYTHCVLSPATVELAPTNADPLEMQAHLHLTPGGGAPPNACDPDLGIARVDLSACAFDDTVRDQLTSCVVLSSQVTASRTGEGVAKVTGGHVTRTTAGCTAIDDLHFDSP